MKCEALDKQGRVCEHEQGHEDYHQSVYESVTKKGWPCTIIHHWKDSK